MARNSYGCSCLPSCTGIGVVISLVLGVIAAFLRYSAVITVGTSFLWVTFGISVLVMLLTLALSARSHNSVKHCICEVLPGLITGIVLTMLTSLILLAVTFAATSIAGAVITGILILSFSIIITSVLCLIICNADCGDED